MAWYWYVLIAIAALFVLRFIAEVIGSRKSAGNDFAEVLQLARQRAATVGANKPPPLSPELKPFVTRLCRVHATVGSFASQETRTIGQEIFDRFGHQGMLSVHEGVRRALGPGPARDLEYKWDHIGEWLG